MKWLYRAKRIFHFKVLNYVITSNHIHLLLVEDGHPGAIAGGMHLAAGLTAQQFNRRKRRCGAFWQDRYHATAVDTGPYLKRCLVYIDLNMVRAGVVRHPQYWPFGGYAEVMGKKMRFRLVDETTLLEVLGVASSEQHRKCRQEWVEQEILNDRLKREAIWTESVAVGSQVFSERIKRELKARGLGKKISNEGDAFRLREGNESYFKPKK
jgi:putative transposase